MGIVNQRVTGLAALVAAVSVLVAACDGPGEPAPTTSSRPAESSTLKRITARGKIIVGIRADTPGLAHRDPVSGVFSGFEVSLVQLVAAGLGLSPQQIAFTQLTPDTSLPSVEAGTVDIYLGGTTAAQARQAGLLTAGPYLTAGLGLLYRKSGPTVSDASTAAGRKVCTVANSAPQGLARDARLTDPDKLVASTSARDCVDELGSGSVDAVADFLPVVSGYASADPSNLAVSALAAPKPVDYVIALPGGDADLRDRLTRIIRTAVTDGTWQRDYDAALGATSPKPAPPSIPS
ncbi:glutamate transport system substrate-binding protein [Kutzneria buriramensis]|uniref:Glutamate transport system substrate-binding protein n=1 Tax=Kutzneria buriramensis TaxID=1045776 RepID=A0A3E0HZ35_9PSEU|nr:glutamate transport system substrate-binding protein [Kutzneria buriramensis]